MRPVPLCHGGALEPSCMQCWGSEMIFFRIRILVPSSCRVRHDFFSLHTLLAPKLNYLYWLSWKFKKIISDPGPNLDEIWFIRIRNWGIFHPWIWDPDPGRDRKISGSGMNFPDYFSESLETVLGLLQYFNSLMRIRIRDLFDPESWMEKLATQNNNQSLPTLPNYLDSYPQLLTLR